MSAYLILIGAADLVGRSPWPLVEAAEALGSEVAELSYVNSTQGFQPSELAYARIARDKVLPDAPRLAALARYNNRAGRRARAKLRDALLEAAARLNDRSRCR